MLFKTTCAAGALLLSIVAPAAAQQDGVFYDPDSPAGTEYAIPLEQARQSTSNSGPSGGSSASSPGDSALFGSGIAPGSDRASRGSGSKGQESARPSKNDSPNLPESVAMSSQVTVDSAGASLGVVALGAAALVLLAGTVAGLALRRRRRA